MLGCPCASPAAFRRIANQPFLGGRKRLRSGCSGRDDMDDPETPRLELVREILQTGGCQRLDVMQQKDALAVGFQPADRAPDDLRRIDRVQSSATTSTLQLMMPREARYRSTEFLTLQTGKPEEGSNLGAIAHCRHDRIEARIDFVRHFQARHLDGKCRGGFGCDWPECALRRRRGEPCPGTSGPCGRP